MKETQYIDLTLKVRVRVYDSGVDGFSPTPDEVGKVASGDLEHCEEGRHHFPAEMVYHGLKKIVENALGRAVEGHFRTLYGTEMVPYKFGDSEGAAQKALVETWKVANNISFGIDLCLAGAAEPVPCRMKVWETPYSPGSAPQSRARLMVENGVCVFDTGVIDEHYASYQAEEWAAKTGYLITRTDSAELKSPG